MLQASRRAPQRLGDSAELVRGFVRGQLARDGGFRGRAGESDLYYTVFGLDCMKSLGMEIPVRRIAPYLRSFGSGDDLDLVHLACLVRSWTALPGVELPASERAAFGERLAGFRTGDGGFAGEPGDPRGSVYGCFLAFGAYQDLGLELPDADAVGEFVAARATAEGGFANQRHTKAAATPVVAAAVTLLRHLSRPVPPGAAAWLAARLHGQGGFTAAPAAPLPDLLSTATALHALAGLGHPLAPMIEPCLDFLDSLWTNRGTFHGHWADDETDCEYTFYGLLALGHLGDPGG